MNGELDVVSERLSTRVGLIRVHSQLTWLDVKPRARSLLVRAGVHPKVVSEMLGMPASV